MSEANFERRALFLPANWTFNIFFIHKQGKKKKSPKKKGKKQKKESLPHLGAPLKCCLTPKSWLTPLKNYTAFQTFFLFSDEKSLKKIYKISQKF